MTDATGGATETPTANEWSYYELRERIVKPEIGYKVGLQAA